jgi:predicted RNA-binding protein with PIN domain
VKWTEAKERMHLDSGLVLGEEEPEEESVPVPRTTAASMAGDKELQDIFERTYGKIKRRDFLPQKTVKREEYSEKKLQAIRDMQPTQEFLLVDGYNIIFAWDELKTLAREDLGAAREALVEILCNYQGYKGCNVILVFDAYKVQNNPGSVEKRGNISVVYTKQAETADMYIEKVTYQIAKHHRVRVATSDGMEQLIILGHGAVRISARLFQQEVEEVSQQISALLQRYNQ